jgi:hypothetical protein
MLQSFLYISRTRYSLQLLTDDETNSTTDDRTDSLSEESDDSTDEEE